MVSIEAILERYMELETAVRELMDRLFSNTCGMCTACCCRVDICEEATESTFLRMVLQKQGVSTDDRDDRYGWLGLHGCILDYGRPPVCHAFFCGELLAQLPDDETRHVIQVLGKLLHYVGDRVLDDLHLVDIAGAARLAKVDFDALSQRLDTAQEILEIVDHYVETGRLSESQHATLGIIAVDDL